MLWPAVQPNTVDRLSGTVLRQTEIHSHNCFEVQGRGSRSLFEKEYVEDWKSSTKTVFARQTKLTLRNSAFLIARNVQVFLIRLNLISHVLS